KFSVTGIPATGYGLLYQWQASADGGYSFQNISDGSQYSGTTNATLTVSNVTPSMNGYEFRCDLMSAGCHVFSAGAALSYVNVAVNGDEPALGTTPVALYNPISFSLGPDLDSNSVSAQSVLAQGFQSGALSASVSLTGNTVNLDPASPYFPGEKVEVSVTDELADQSGLQAQPFVWDFRASVPNSNSLQYVGESLTNAGGYSDVSVGDFHHDGRLDILAAGASGAQLWTNDGVGRLEAGQTLTNGSVLAVRAADLNGDGWLDAALLAADGSIAIYLNNHGVLTYSGQTIGQGVLGLAFGDLSGSGNMDLFVVGNGPAQVWLNNGDGSFSDSGQRLGSGGVDVQLGDLNCDGMLDAVVAGPPGQANVAWLNSGWGEFAPGLQPLGIAGGGSKVVVADFNGQGHLDVLVTQTNGPTQGWVNNGQGSLWNLSGEALQPGDPIYAGIFGNNIGNNGSFPYGNVTN